MPQTIAKPIGVLLEEANAVIGTMKIGDVLTRYADETFVFIDLRDQEERQRHGEIPGSIHCPRGMLEFYIDPGCPVHKPVFAQDKTFVFYCASGWRSAFAGKHAAEMGLRTVVNLEGGIEAWKKIGGTVISVD